MEQPRQNINSKTTDQSSASSVPTTPTLPTKSNRGNKRNLNINGGDQRKSVKNVLSKYYEIVAMLCIIIVIIAIFGFAMNSMIFRTFLLLTGLTVFMLVIRKYMTSNSSTREKE